MFGKQSKLVLAILLVALHCPDGDEGGDKEEGEHLVGNGMEIATSHEDGADGIGEIVHGVDVGGEVCPVGHGAHGGEES